LVLNNYLATHLFVSAKEIILVRALQCDQKMYFRDRKSLNVFERKIPLTFFSEYRFHQDHA